MNNSDTGGEVMEKCKIHCFENFAQVGKCCLLRYVSEIATGEQIIFNK